jgi:gliding motility-associated-like protein
MQFVVTVNDENGCNNQYAVIVEVECNLFIPNSFTPNTDGKNEKFHIYTGGIKALEFRIFNRWGEELFFTDDETQGWDGTYKGNLVPEGTYVYSVWLIMPDGTERDLKGMLQLIR